MSGNRETRDATGRDGTKRRIVGYRVVYEITAPSTSSELQSILRPSAGWTCRGTHGRTNDFLRLLRYVVSLLLFVNSISMGIVDEHSKFHLQDSITRHRVVYNIFSGVFKKLS